MPHHPHRRWLRGHGYWKRLGPGIVTGAADDDPSGIGTYSQVGAALLVAVANTFNIGADIGSMAAAAGLLSQLLVGAAAVVMAALSVLAALP
jgi:hypothetical protein